MSVYKGDKLVAGKSVDTYLARNPAWDQAILLSLEALTGGYTAPADGMIVGILYTHGTTSTGVSVKVNGVEVARNKAKDSDHILNVQCPVGKDDVITISDEESQINPAISFVPFKDSTVSDVEVVTAEYISNLHDPDWSRAITITPDQLRSEYITPGRGIIVGWVLSVLDKTDIKVNDVVIGTSINKSGSWSSYSNIQIPVNKNDVVKVTQDISSKSIDLSFVPYKAQ